MSAHSHPARERLLAAGRQMPGVWQAMAAQRLAHPPAHPCMYITEPEAAEAVIEAGMRAHGPQWMQQLAQLGPLGVTRAVQPYATLGAWRMTQGIYRIDPTLYASLIDTPLTGDLPADVLMRLPEWCVYIEAPGLPVAGVNGSSYRARGLWARCYVDRDASVLVIAMDVPEADTIECQHVPLGAGLVESLQELVRDWRGSNVHVPGPDELEGALSYVRPAINLLLYLCSTTDITGPGAPGNPAPVRTRRHGEQLFPAAGPRTWDVGVRIGAALRRAYAAEQAAGQAGPAGTHAGPRPHIRRAHWHTILSGPRTRDGAPLSSAQRRADLRWMPPIPVMLGDVDDLPAVVRAVK